MLKDMYSAVIPMIKSDFYGFCNGDILFDDSLPETLNRIWGYICNFQHPTLVIGRRINVNFTAVYKELKSRDPKVLASLAQSYGSLFDDNAEDYFFISFPEKFPWSSIKEVVIGRPAYDNYLVGEALRGNVSVIDATNTILALHQTGNDGVHAGFNNEDSDYNTNIIGRYNYLSGLVSQSQYYTQRDFAKKVILLKRTKQ